MINTISKSFESVIDLFFPKVCHACNTHLQDNEAHICTSCRHDLPVTNYHFNNDPFVKNVLYGRVAIENATALLRFEKKGAVQQLIHSLKYKGHETIGVFLGEWLGNELKTLPNYNVIDMVIAVPLHQKKLKQRGYNQVTRFGQCIAEALEVPYNENALVKVTNTKTQSKKNRISRWRDSDELFTLENKPLIEGKHILLVDDIITTGATLEACINVLNQANNLKISIATMAIA